MFPFISMVFVLNLCTILCILLYDTVDMGYFFNKTFVDISAVHTLLITSTYHLLFMKHFT